MSELGEPFLFAIDLWQELAEIRYVAPYERFRRIHAVILDILIACLWLFFVTGGLEWEGKVRFGYVTDLTRVLILWYALGRTLLRVRLSDTLIGGSILRFLEGLRTSQQVVVTLFFLSVAQFFFLFLAVPVLRHHAFGSWVWDLGIIENALRNLAFEGSAFTYFLSPDGGETPLRYFPNNRLIFGFFALAPLYRLFPWTETLLLLQSLALLAGAVPSFLLARRVLRFPLAGYWGAAFYLALQTIHKLQVWDVHEVSFAIPFGLWAFYFLETKRYGPSLFLAVLMAAWREDLWLVFSGFALLWGRESKRPVLGTMLALAGLAVLPLHAHFFNVVNTVGSRYPLFGEDLPSAMASVASRPWLILEAAGKNGGFFLRLAVMYGAGALFLAGPWRLLPAVLPIAELGLSQHSAMTSFHDHYVGNLVAPLFFAMLHGWRKILDRWPKRGLQCVAVLFAVSQFWFSPELMATARRLRSDPQGVQCRKRLVLPLQERAGAKVIATNSLGSHLTHREWIQLPGPHRGTWSRAELAVLTAEEASLYGKELESFAWVKAHSDCGFEVWERQLPHSYD